MPQLNRDQETLYSTPRLHVVFLATSALLVAGIVWMMAGDYVRDWKGVQKDYYRRQAGLLEAEREMQERAVEGKVEGKEDVAAELKEVTAKLAEERARLDEPARAAELAALRDAVAEQKTRGAEAERDLKAVKGAFAERRYAYEMAMKEGANDRAERLAREVNALAGRQDTLEHAQREAHDSFRPA